MKPILYCDLKPINILLNKVMVAHDFGISKLLGDEDSITQTITLATIGYMAPGDVSNLQFNLIFKRTHTKLSQ